jgi:hypothetical protein
MEYTADEVVGMLADSPEHPRVCVIELRAHDSAWDPASTKRKLYGPGIVAYTLHTDGSVEASLAKIPTVAEFREKHKENDD